MTLGLRARTELCPVISGEASRRDLATTPAQQLSAVRRVRCGEDARARYAEDQLGVPVQRGITNPVWINGAGPVVCGMVGESSDIVCCGISWVKLPVV